MRPRPTQTLLQWTVEPGSPPALTRFARIAPYLLGGVARAWGVMLPFEAAREAHRGVVVLEGAWPADAVPAVLAAAKAETGLAVHVQTAPEGVELALRVVDAHGVVAREATVTGAVSDVLVDVATWLGVAPEHAAELAFSADWLEPYAVALDVLARAPIRGVNQGAALDRALMLLPAAVNGRAALVFAGLFFTLLKDTDDSRAFRDLGLRLARTLDTDEVWRALLELGGARRDGVAAQAALERLAALCPEDATVGFQLAVAKLRSNDAIGARRLLEARAEDARWTDLAEAYLAVVDMHEGEPERGRQRWERVVERGAHPHALAIARENLRRMGAR